MRKFVVLFLFLFSISSAHGQDRVFKVAYDITAEESIKAEVTSYIGRELRALGDVEIVESTADWELSIMGLRGIEWVNSAHFFIKSPAACT